MENPGELKVSELGIPMHDLDYENDKKNKSNGDFSRASSFDGDNYSQSDLVNNAARH
jgi:hypothetical protein